VDFLSKNYDQYQQQQQGHSFEQEEGEEGYKDIGVDQGENAGACLRCVCVCVCVLLGKNWCACLYWSYCMCNFIA